MQNLQAILDQDDSLLRFYKNGTGWTGQVIHVSNGTVVLEIHGDSILQVQNSYTKWLYSPLESAELKLPQQTADTMLNN